MDLKLKLSLLGQRGAGGPPAAPSSLTATTSGAGSIDLAWTDNSDDEDYFEIERSPDGSTGWTQVAVVGTGVTTHTDMGLANGTEYFYRVRAVNSIGESSYSNTDSATTTANTLLDDLIAHWPFDHGSTRLDSVGNAHALDISVVGTATGKINDAGAFNASESDYLETPADDMTTGDIDFSFAGWVFLSSKVTGTIFSKWHPESEYALDYDAGADRFRFYVDSTAGGGGTTIAVANNLGAPSTGTWYFIYVYHDAANDEIGIEINRGTADTAAHTTGVDTDNDTPFEFGRRKQATPANYLQARLDGWSFWKRLLTSGELDSLYNSGSGHSTIASDAKELCPSPTMQPDGVWSWFSHPRAVRFNGNTYFGWVNSVGDIEIGSFADNTKLTPRFYLMDNELEVDDHDNPTILVRDSDSKILVFWSKHDGTDMWVALSTNAEDISAFGAATALDASIGGTKYTYPNPVQLTGEVNDPIYLFYRDRDGSDNATWAYSKSTDGGGTWSARTLLAKGAATAGMYLTPVVNGTDRIDFVVTDDNPASSNTSIYHFYYSGGNYYQSDGTQIVSGLPLDETDMTLVYDGSTTPAWHWDIAIDGSGHPVIGYATMPTKASDHRYNQARWNGSSWSSVEVAQGGGPLPDGSGAFHPAEYSGGMAIDHADVDIVYVSREVSSQHEIWKYTSDDNGQTWSGEAITSSSAKPNGRPVVPINAGGGVRVMWWQGDYSSDGNYPWLQYKTNIRSSPR